MVKIVLAFPPEVPLLPSAGFYGGAYRSTRGVHIYIFTYIYIYICKYISIQTRRGDRGASGGKASTLFTTP